MRPDEAAPVASFSRHETFHLRYGWLKKGYDAMVDDARVFLREDATVRLGVGKNMVRSMRFWGMAAKVYAADKRAQATRPTELGRAIFDDGEGLDPYLENPGMLWVLHWLLFAPPCLLPTWWVVMNDTMAAVVGTDDLRKRARAAVERTVHWKSPSVRSVDKDLDVFVHTYSSKRGRDMIEDYIDCPFRNLRLLRQSARDEMRFVQGRKPGMSPLAVAFACLDFVERTDSAGRTVTAHRLAMERGGPGRAMCLGESDIAEMLSEAAEECASISVQNVNGTPSLSFRGGAAAAKAEALYAMYGRRPPARARRAVQEAMAA